ncbi:MAG: hypothetical protein GXO32_08430 [Crenarchaeota archaeon]|nr:hypothetical protein [Thermoproteota archaeon]
MSRSIEISDELWRRLQALRTIVDRFAGLTFDTDSSYVEFLLNLAIHKVLSDVLSDPDARLDVIKALFSRYPEAVADAINSIMFEDEEPQTEVRRESGAPMYT